jgi:hypothetical protein
MFVANRRYQTLLVLLYKDPPSLATIFQTFGLYSLEARWSSTPDPLLDLVLLYCSQSYHPLVGYLINVIHH